MSKSSNSSLPEALSSQVANAPSTSFFDNLCDDTLMRILSYADLPSLVYFTRETCHSLNARFCPLMIHDDNNAMDAAAEEDDDGIKNEKETVISQNNCSGSGASGRSSVPGISSHCHHLWRDTFYRHNFSPLPMRSMQQPQFHNSKNASNNHNHNTNTNNSSSFQKLPQQMTEMTKEEQFYYHELRKRLDLFANLTGSRQNRKYKASFRQNNNDQHNQHHHQHGYPTSWKKIKQCFSLPHRCFYFVPLVPPDMIHYAPLSLLERSLRGGAAATTAAADENRNDNDDTDEEWNRFPNNLMNNRNHNFNNNNNAVEFNDDDDENEANDDADIEEVDEDEEEDEPPPVEFACDSYSLTCPGTGGEFVLLDPFSGSIQVYDSVLDNAIGSEEGMLEKALEEAMEVASEGILRKRSGGVGVLGISGMDGIGMRDGTSGGGGGNEDDENSEDIAGDAIHHRMMIHHNHRDNKMMYDTPPKQVLFDVQDYFDLNLQEYFGDYTPFAEQQQHHGQHQHHPRHQPGNHHRNIQRSGNVTVDWVGIDTHVALNPDGRSLAGNVIGAGRILTMESDDGRGNAELECMEVFAWTNFHGLNLEGCGTGYDDDDAVPSTAKSMYDSKFVCRAAGSPYYLDICANSMKLYASFQAGSEPFAMDRQDYANRLSPNNHPPLMDIDDDESVVGDNGEPIKLSKAIFRLPFIRHDKKSSSSPEAIRSYFPSPEACLTAQYPVSSFIVDPTGKALIVGTDNGTIELWDTGVYGDGDVSSPRVLQRLSVRQSFLKRARSRTMDERRNSNGNASSAASVKADEGETNVERRSNVQDDLALLPINLEQEVPHKHPTSKISSIFLSSHRPVHQCGFITKQRHREFGTTLLLWQLPTMSSDTNPDFSNERFQIMAMINLPLSVQCHPEVYYDGKRLIVFGKDHIGLIFLVYHVLSTRFDQHEFEDTKMPSTRPRAQKCGGRSSSRSGDESGGVVHLHPNGEPRVKFVNRIRHAGLGGLEYYDYMSLTANERFLVVNTKTGNLVGSDGARNASQGLLVIDLLEHGC